MDRSALTPTPSHPASASAKFLLAGEYSVLIEGPALAIPLNQLRLEYEESSGETDFTETKVFLNGSEIADSARREKVLELREIISSSELPAQININTQIPIGKGLGSSAALCVAMARYLTQDQSTENIARTALEGEKLFHGNPSGVDPYCVSFEIPVAYTRHPRHCVRLKMHSLKNSDFVFFLKDSGGEHSTKNLIQSVLEKESLVLELSNHAQKMLYAVENDAERVPYLMKTIHRELSDLGASSPQIEENIDELYSLGALGAKLTGSGRGGFVLSIFSKHDFATLPLSVQKSGYVWVPSQKPISPSESI